MGRAKDSSKRTQARGLAVRIAVFLLVFACCLLPALFANRLVGYVPVLLFAFAVTLCGAYLLVIRTKVDFSVQAGNGDCIRGEEIAFTVSLTNRSILPIPRVLARLAYTNLFGQVEETIEARTVLAPHESSSFAFYVRFQHVGTYEAGLGTLRVYDPTGLFSARADVGRMQRIEVAPRIYDLERLEIEEVSLTESEDAHQAVFFDSLDYTGVRDYALGDSMRLIHWKLSARTDQYYTKLFESYGNPGVCVLLDLHAPYDDPDLLMSAYDGLVEAACSLGRYALDNGLDFEMKYLDDDACTVSLDKTACADGSLWVSQMPPARSDAHHDDLPRLLEGELDASGGLNNVVLVTAGLTDAIAADALQLRSIYKNPIVFLVAPAQLSRSERDELLRPLALFDESDVATALVDPDSGVTLGWCA